MQISIHVLYNDTYMSKFGQLLSHNKRLLHADGVVLNGYRCESPDLISQSRASAMRNTNADYFGWIDADDLYLPGAYPKLIDTIKSCEIGFAWMNELMVVIDRDQREIHTDIVKYPHHMFLIHRDLIDWYYLQNNPEIKTPDRWLTRLQDSGTHVKEVGYIWRRSIGGLSFGMYD